MKQAIFSRAEDASEYLANHIIDKINEFNPSALKPFVLGLPTGSSPEGVYAKLIEANRQGKFFNHIDIPRQNIHILNGLSKDIEAECANYEAKIKSFGRINLFMGGLGPEGHLAFNEAGSKRESRTRKVELVKSTIKANSRFFSNDESKVPKYALSVGISTILDNSDEIVLIVLGELKKFALDKTIWGTKNDSNYPSLYLQDHSNVLIVCDHSAAGLKAKL
ncbi:Glucosamine-6-phosphate isomerase (Glucosamine-6-phosphate deaminase) (GNPDA) (GlcN6P deaminase) [Cerrena zonata]|uniref:glucosamine-6-phosphate deaminase n=1 Tax=Cerrena zonata TaxID=2478898 RepID=A0AAW0FQ37_9APHY